MNPFSLNCWRNTRRRSFWKRLDTYLANLNSKKANFIKAKKDFDRAKSLIASKSISSQAFDDYTYQYESTKAALDEAQISLNYTNVTAPIDGIIGIKKFDIGDLVGKNDDNSLLLQANKVRFTKVVTSKEVILLLWHNKLVRFTKGVKSIVVNWLFAQSKYWFCWTFSTF